jgi:hypothetical protein
VVFLNLKITNPHMYMTFYEPNYYTILFVNHVGLVIHFVARIEFLLEFIRIVLGTNREVFYNMQERRELWDLSDDSPKRPFDTNVRKGAAIYRALITSMTRNNKSLTMVPPIMVLEMAL